MFFEQPEIAPHLTLLMAAFTDLSTERQFGMGVGPVPQSKVRDYVKSELGMSGGVYEWACAVIRKVDDAYVSMANKSASKKPGDDPELSESVKATDSQGVKSLMRGLGQRHKNTKTQKTKK